jgi:hypothetical protein
VPVDFESSSCRNFTVSSISLSSVGAMPSAFTD